MFFNLTWRNAKRSRSENLIYFLTMITAVAMFYIVLSLGQQDVIRFLSEIESDAVERLLTNLLPTVYLCALLFVFFLVVFANKYQLECRSRELGLYLMFGMTKIKLFIQIMTEGLITSFLALLGGLVCGGFLSEAISLTTARLVGHGIITHQLSFSVSAAIFTSLGFLIIQFMGKEADILAKIVVVEDDVYMREELLNLLEKSGYDTIGLSDFENAVSEIAAYFPDLILLDINLPFRSGFEICKELKAKQIGTVLVLTARDKLQDELHALDLGADDYLTKPCNMSRLLARIKNLLRRKEEQVQQGLLDGGGFLLDPNTFTIYVGNSSYLMPPNEGKILLALLKNSPKIVSKKELCIRLWGTEEFIDENALQVNFTRLRKTLREFGLEERIETVRGQGYRLKEQVDI